MERRVEVEGEGSSAAERYKMYMAMAGKTALHLRLYKQWSPHVSSRKTGFFKYFPQPPITALDIHLTSNCMDTAQVLCLTFFSLISSLKSLSF